MPSDTALLYGHAEPRHRNEKVLVSGASFAGLTTAFWMNRLGYAVTVVEVANRLKTGGSPVDIKGGTVDIVRRMGLLERIQGHSLKAKGIDHMLFDEVKNDVEFLFDQSIARIEEPTDEIAVTFKSGERRSFSFLFGCDGNHSSVRRMCFGKESSYSHSLQNYFSITIVDKLLIDEDTAQMYNVPGKVVMLNAYNKKTDIIFCFYSAQKIRYNYRDQAEQRQIIREQFRGERWRTAELLEELDRSESFYFDKMCQIKMPGWTKGRVALVGDAAYCASPAAGMGGSLAIVGATALADAFQNHPDDFEAAFREYNCSLRPFVEEVQEQAISFGLEMFIPRTEETLLKRNAQFSR